MRTSQRLLYLSLIVLLLLCSVQALAQYGGQYGRSGDRPREGACFYSDSDYRGESFCARAGEEMATMPPGFNDRVSSIEVFGRAQVMLYSDPNFQGKSAVLNNSTPNLKTASYQSWNDRISSFRIEYVPGYAAEGDFIRCSSDDGGRHYCPVNTRWGVDMARQVSGSPCVFQSTWGYDERGIWVDRGCRAEFTLRARQYPQSMPGQTAGQTFVCASDDERRHYCPAETRWGVDMVRQISGTPCTQNMTWGYDAQGVWVDRGCRAEFVSRQQPVGGSAGTFTCASDDMRRHSCPMDTRGGVDLIRQISGSECRFGYSWGYDAQGVWVDRGCRAEFAVATNRQYSGRGQLVTCSSDDGGRKVCAVDTRAGVFLRRQISGSPCQQGVSWGYNRRGIWVDRGCRAEFVVGAY